MTQPNPAATLLYWAMVLAGGLLVAPCLILPAWIEYQAALDLRGLREQQVQQREAEIEQLRRQREHLETDDAYVLRLASESLNVEIPGVERIPIEPSPVDPEAALEAEIEETPPDEIVPELSALFEQALQRYPLARLFILPRVRPALLFTGGALIVAAIVLLCAPTIPRRRGAANERRQAMDMPAR